MSHTLCGARAWSAVGNDQVFCWNEDRRLTANARVEVDLLERRTGQTQVVQHALVLGSVLGHLLRELVVHVIANSLGCFFFEFVDGSDDLGLDWTRSRECFDDGLGLKTDRGLSQHGGEHAAGTSPWFGALFILHAKDLKAFDVHLNPVLAAGNVGFKLTQEVVGQFSKLAIVHKLCEVGTEIFRRFFVGHEVNFNAIDADHHAIWVLNLNLDCRGVILHDIFKAHPTGSATNTGDHI